MRTIHSMAVALPLASAAFLPEIIDTPGGKTSRSSQLNLNLAERAGSDRTTSSIYTSPPVSLPQAEVVTVTFTNSNHKYHTTTSSFVMPDSSDDKGSQNFIAVTSTLVDVSPMIVTHTVSKPESTMTINLSQTLSLTSYVTETVTPRNIASVSSSASLGGSVHAPDLRARFALTDKEDDESLIDLHKDNAANKATASDLSSTGDTSSAVGHIFSRAITQVPDSAIDVDITHEDTVSSVHDGPEPVHVSKPLLGKAVESMRVIAIASATISNTRVIQSPHSFDESALPISTIAETDEDQIKAIISSAVDMTIDTTLPETGGSHEAAIVASVTVIAGAFAHAISATALTKEEQVPMGINNAISRIASNVGATPAVSREVTQALASAVNAAVANGAITDNMTAESVLKSALAQASGILSNANFASLEMSASGIISQVAGAQLSDDRFASLATHIHSLAEAVFAQASASQHTAILSSIGGRVTQALSGFAGILNLRDDHTTVTSQNMTATSIAITSVTATAPGMAPVASVNGAKALWALSPGALAIAFINFI